MKIFIIDLYSIIFKSYYALPDLRNSKGIPTNAVFGTLKSILKCIKQFNVENLVIVADTGKKTFRHKVYSDYKANRLAAPDDLSLQFPMIREALNKFNFNVFEKENYEADDVIYSLVNKFKNEELFIISSDKDLYQLITGKVKVISESKFTGTQIIGIAETKKKFGVVPEQIVDYLSLVGDSSDNVPGVKGIGKKTASSLLEQFNNLEEIYNSIDEIKSNSVKNKLIAGKENAFLSQSLVQLKQVELNVEKEDLKIKDYDRKIVYEFLNELELNSIIKDVEDKDTIFPEQKEKWLTEFESIKPVIIDYDDNRIDECNKLFFGSKNFIIFYFSHKNLLYLLFSDYKNFIIFKNEDESNIKKFVEKYFNDEDNSFVVYNIKDFFQKYFKGISIEKFKKIICRIFDLSIACYLIDSDEINISLSRILNKYCGGTYYFNINFKKTQLPVIFKYYQFLIIKLGNVDKKLASKLQELKLKKIYDEIELPLTIILFEMEREGISIDKEYLIELQAKILKDIDEIKKKIYLHADESLNLNSPKQLSELLFETLNLPKFKKIKTGYSTDNEVLEKLKNFHELPALILEYRSLTKLESTYVASYLDLEKNGRIHTTFNQCITTTGRLSSSNPNLQNIPVEKEDHYSIRRVFKASPGCKLISADYSQIELRILAHMSNDERMIEAFNNDEDIHARTAQEIFGTLIEIDKGMRRAAKTVNFGIIYGMSAFSLAKDLGIKMWEAKEYIDKYFDRYKNVKKYLDGTIAFARENGYVETMFGRIRYIKSINDKNKNIRNAAGRMAINMPVQGTAADVLKIAMIKLFDELKDYKTKMLLSVHDELVFNAPESEVDKVKVLIKANMENVVELKVPLKVDISVGDTWKKE